MVTLLGGGDVEFTHDINGLTVKVPATKPNAIAPVFRITFKASTQSAYEQLQGLIEGVEHAVEQAAQSAQPYNTGKTSPTKLTNSTASVVTEVTDGQLTLGVELKNYQSNDCKFDHFTLEFLGASIDDTGIPAAASSSQSAAPRVFDLTGRRRSHPVKGFNIVDGQKLIRK